MTRPRSLNIPVARDLSSIGLGEHWIKDGLMGQTRWKPSIAAAPNQYELAGTNATVKGYGFTYVH
jgi:hypothetical protein